MTTQSTFTIYEKPSGKVYCHFHGWEPSSQIFDTTKDWIDGSIDGKTHYVNLTNPSVNPYPEARPTMPIVVSKSEIIANGVDESVISGIPTDAVVDISGPISGSVTVSDGTLEFVASIAGTYSFKISKFPYLDYQVSINAI